MGGENNMRKKDETTKPNTCLAVAAPEEMVFVLLGRDPAAPYAIRAWAAERIRLGKNKTGDAQIVAAINCADTMAAEGRMHVKEPRAITGRERDYFFDPDD